jgi:hypothetical protein
MNMRKIKKLFLCFSLAIIFAVASYGQAGAGILDFGYDIVFSGDTPGASAPYLTAIFDDTAAAATWDV